MLLRRILNFICLLILTIAVIGCSYTKDLTVLNRKQAVYDLDYLVKNVKEKHPNPFAHINEEEFNTSVRQIKADLGDKIDRKDFSLIIAELLALMCDAHTGHYDFPDFVSFYDSGGKIFPVKLRYKNDRMVINSWQEEIQPKYMEKGDIVVSINGKSVESLLKEYGKYIPGTTSHQRNCVLERRLHYFLWLIEEEEESFELTLINSKGEEYTETIPAIAAIPNNDPKNKKRQEVFNFEFYLDKKVCFFKAPSFWENLLMSFMKSVEALIIEMKKNKTEILIVDLRGNGGGGGMLPYQLLRSTINKPVLESPGGKLIRPTSNGWNGTLVVLCDRGTASAAVYFAVIVKDSKAGIIAGEETGGRASYFGNVHSIQLPNSGLRFNLATAHFMRPAGYDDGHGVLPDLPLNVTLEDSVLVEKINDYLIKNKVNFN